MNQSAQLLSSSTPGAQSQPFACKSFLISTEFALSGKPCGCKQRVLPCKLPLAQWGSAGEGSSEGGCGAAHCVPAPGLAASLEPVATCEHRNWSFLPVPAFPLMLPPNLSPSLVCSWEVVTAWVLHRGAVGLKDLVTSCVLYSLQWREVGLFLLPS